MEGNIPSPNFDGDTSNFLAFSSTPVQGNNFKPKWGKKNRQSNWNRFGQLQDGEKQPDSQFSSPAARFVRPEQSRGNYRDSPHHRGNFSSPHQGFSPRAGWGGRGGNTWNNSSPRFQNNYSGNNSFHSPSHHQQHNQYKQFHQQQYNPHHQQQQYNPHQQQQQSYRGGRGARGNHGGGDGGGQRRSFFHPSMVEDPWAKLESRRSRGQRTHPSLSDSLIPQVGESLLDRNKELNDTQQSELESESSTETASQ